MSHENPKDSHDLRPTTQVLTHGFDPSLSVGSARPAVFRSSTYVFSSPEAAERAFDVATGRATAKAGEQPELIIRGSIIRTRKFSRHRSRHWSRERKTPWSSTREWRRS